MSFSTLNKTTGLSLVVVASLGLYLVITSAFFPLDFLSVFDAKRVIQLALFAAIMVFAVAWAPLREATVAQLARLSKFQRYAFALFFLIGIVSSMRLEHPAYALVDVSMMFVMMILIFVTAASRELAGERFDKLAVVLLAVMGFAVALQEFMGFIVGWVIGSEFSYEQALIHFAHPRFYNQLQTWSIPVLAAIPLLFPGKLWLKIGCLSLIGFQWFLVIALAARGTAVSLFIAMLFVALWLPAHRKYWLKFQFGGLLLGVAFYLGVIGLNEALIPKPQSQSQSGDFYAYSVGRPMAHTSGRSTFWRLSLKDSLKHPILGSGPTRFACSSDLILPAHPHNFPLRILGEWGVIAFLVFLTLAITIGLGFLMNIKRLSKAGLKDSLVIPVLSISFLAGIIHACLSGVLIMPASQVATILIAGWVLSLTKNSQSKPQTLTLIIAALAAMILAFTTFTFAIHETSKLQKPLSHSDPQYRMMPRFWQDGKACGRYRSYFFE